jgi:hypothetical protein
MALEPRGDMGFNDYGVLGLQSILDSVDRSPFEHGLCRAVTLTVEATE